MNNTPTIIMPSDTESEYESSEDLLERITYLEEEIKSLTTQLKDSKKFMPKNYKNQMASYKFDFFMLFKSKAFQKLFANAVDNDYVRDLADEKYSFMSPEEAVEYGLIDKVMKTRT